MSLSPRRYFPLDSLSLGLDGIHDTMRIITAHFEHRPGETAISRPVWLACLIEQRPGEKPRRRGVRAGELAGNGHGDFRPVVPRRRL
jgi:hypothetical protein